MTYVFKENPILQTNDALIATALNGVVFIENGRLHVKGNKMYFIYKPSASPAGWYARNIKTLDDIYLGEGACPTSELENLTIINASAWENIKQEEQAESEAVEYIVLE